MSDNDAIYQIIGKVFNKMDYIHGKWKWQDGNWKKNLRYFKCMKGLYLQKTKRKKDKKGGKKKEKREKKAKFIAKSR